MSYLTVSFDLLAGLLIGLHLWVPKPHRERWDRFLIERLAPDDNPVDEITLKGSIIGTSVMVIVTMVWGYFTDINKGNVPAEELIKTSLLTTAGLPIAVILLIAVIVLYQKLHRKMKLIHRIPLVSVIAATAVIVGILALLLTKVAGQSFDSMILGFVFSLVFLTLLVEVLPMARRFLTFESGILARLGITMFIASKIILMVNLG